MIHHRIFPKGEYCHALISSRSNPNILFQVRGLIYDVKMDEFNPQYRIKIVRFYDDINFLKQNLFGYKFQRDFKNRDAHFRFKRDNFDTREDFEKHITNHKSWEKYTVVADSIMTTKTLVDSTQMLNEINTFLIEKHLKDLYDIASRTTYRTGQLHFKNRDEFRFAVKRFLKDKMEVTDSWLDDLIARASFSELDDLD
jgi:hypothetical protein